LAIHSEKCTFLSHDDKVKGYSCYQPSTHNVIISCDVKIVETFNPIILNNDTFVVDIISDPPLCELFVLISTLDFNYLSIFLVENVDQVSPSSN